MLGVHELRSDEEISRAFPLMSSLRDRIRAETFLSEVDSRLTAKGFYERLGFDFLTAIPCCLEVGKALAEERAVL